MEPSFVTIIVAIVLIFIAWKFLTGIIKTVALLGILAVAALVVFGGVLA